MGKKRTGWASRKWPQQNANDTKENSNRLHLFLRVVLRTLRLFRGRISPGVLPFPLIRVHRRSSAVKTVSGLLFAVQGFLHAGNLSSVRRFRRIFFGTLRGRGQGGSDSGISCRAYLGTCLRSRVLYRGLESLSDAGIFETVYPRSRIAFFGCIKLSSKLHSTCTSRMTPSVCRNQPS
jgi:hypothetical protein